MKRCPTCQKTFDDNLRFCQTDGTPLVADETPADPYKTMVASKEDIASALRAQSEPPKPAEPISSSSPPADEEPLQIPSEPMINSSPASELKTRLATPPGEDSQVIDLPPLAEAPPSEPPSPFGGASNEAPQSSVGNFPTTPPIPSPFSGANPPASFEPPPAAEPIDVEPEPVYTKPEPPARAADFAEPKSAPASPFSSPQPPAGKSAIAQAEWTPPSPVSSFQDQPGGKNMQSPPPAAAGQNKTLAIISLVSSILGSTFCCAFFIFSIAGIILGFMARGKANSDPSHYGGGGLALAGMLIGVLGLVLGLGVWIFEIAMGGLGVIMNAAGR
ncbi:MAG TPA: DUF4190 domain-containing protein [Pyrinomonadaceae bacterium]